jgi:hypothetical protein
VNNRRMWREVIVAEFEVLSWGVHGGRKGDCGKTSVTVAGLRDLNQGPSHCVFSVCYLN